MKKILVSTVALALGLSMTTTALAYERNGDDLTDIIRSITMSVKGLDLLTFNAAVNTADIDGSVTIEAGGKLQSSFPAPSGTGEGMMTLSDVLSTFINKIDAVAIGAYTNGTVEIAAATESVKYANKVEGSIDITLDASQNVEGSKAITDGAGSMITWCGIKESGAGSYNSDFNSDASLDAGLAAELSLDKSFELNTSGLIGDTIAFNAALNTGDIDASVNIGGKGSSGFSTTLAAIDFTNVQISTQAIGAYTAGTINVGFSALAAK